MSLELLLATMCAVSNNSDACTSAARAYYDYSGIGINVRQIEESYKNKYKSFAAAFTVANIIVQKKMAAPLYRNAAISIRPIENQNGAVVLYEYNY